MFVCLPVRQPVPVLFFVSLRLARLIYCYRPREYKIYEEAPFTAVSKNFWINFLSHQNTMKKISHRHWGPLRGSSSPFLALGAGKG